MEQRLLRRESDDYRDWLFYAVAGIVQTEVEIEPWRAFWRTTVDGISPVNVANELGVGIGSV